MAEKIDNARPFVAPLFTFRFHVAFKRDVIDGKGDLVDRVKLPFGRVISGFGHGVVYLGVQDEKGARLEMARIK